MNDPIEVAYLSGYLDGEGCIAAYPPRYAPFIQIGSTDRRPLARFQAMFGGALRLDRWEKGHKTSFRKKQVWVWHLASPKSLDALRAMLPYLITKKDQAEVALQFQYRTRQGTYSEPGRAGAFPLTAEEKADRIRIGNELRALKRLPSEYDESRVT